MRKALVFIGVGSNIDPERNIPRALFSLKSHARIVVVAISTFYLTEPIGNTDQPPFYNGVVEIETNLPPRELKFSILRAIEARLGRRRNHDRCAPRTIDLDVLIYDDLVLDEPDMRIPSPDILSRAFVAIPLYELAPGRSLPGWGITIANVFERQSHDGMTPLWEFSFALRKAVLDGSETS